MAKAIDKETLASVRHDYFRPWNASCPPVGDLSTVDCIWIQAYGRNTFTDAELGQVIDETRRAAEYDDLKTFALFHKQGLVAGKPNEDLGLFATALAAKLYVPIIGQFEAPYAVWKLGLEDFEDLQRKYPIIPFWPPADKPYFNSWDGLQECIRISKELGCSRPAIVAHDCMRVRVLAMAWALKVNAVVPDMRISSFDPNSIQPHTRSMQAWLPRETFGRYIYFPLKGMVSLAPPK